MTQILWRDLVSYIDRFLEYLIAEKNVKKNTYESYISDLKTFSNFLIVTKRLDLDFRSEDLTAYIKHIAEINLSNATICRKLSALRQFLKFLFSEKVLNKDYGQLVELPKKNKKLPKFLTVKEIKLLLEHAKSDMSFPGKRFNVILHLTYGSGFRVSEVVSLKKSTLQYKGKSELDNFLIIYGKGGKERLVPLNNLCLQILEEYLAILESTIYKSSPYLFPSESKEGFLTRQRFGQQLKRLAFDSGVDPDRVSPHILRHSLATHLLSSGADLRVIQEILGHETIMTTEIYTHLLNSDVKAMLFDKHPLNKHQV